MRKTNLLHVGLFSMLAVSTACSQKPPTATIPPQAQSNLSAPGSVRQIQQGAMGGNIAANIGANAGLGNLAANLGQPGNLAANVGQLSNVGTNLNMPRTFTTPRVNTMPRTVTTPRNTIPRTFTNRRIFTNNRLLFPYSTYYYPNYYPNYYNNYAYAANVVTVQNYAFNPYDISVPIGGSVTWINNDPVAHTTTSPGMWDGELYPGARFTYTFTRPGDFPYYCRYHPYMHGVVHVGAY